MPTELFKKIANQYQNKLPFVVYRKPSAKELHYVYQNTTLLHKVTNYTESGFVFSPFDASKPSLLIPFEHSETVAYTTQSLPNYKLKTTTLPKENDALHKKLVSEAVQVIKHSECNKIVLSRQVRVTCDKNPVTLFKTLVKLYPNACVYLWFHPKVGCWLAATPEQFLKVRGTVASTVSLAGTQPYSENVKWGAKEREEQQIVTEFIVSQATPFTTSIEVKNTQTIKAGNLAHLKTDLVLKLSNATSLQELIAALHPTPAVCGVPKTFAKSFIVKNESYDRAYYTGFLGELNKPETRPRHNRNIENNAYRLQTKTSELYVNLRCMQMQGSQVLIYVGGGITASSIPELEYEETVRKAATMYKAINSEEI